MPTRKQRRRRDKDFRHEVRVFEVDDEGNEVPIAELRAREEKPEKPQAKKQGPAKSRSGRPMREVAPPSWNRALKRGGMMGGAMLLVFVFVLRSGPPAQRLAIGLFYGIAFVPLTYWIDRTAYRGYQKRLARPEAKRR